MRCMQFNHVKSCALCHQGMDFPHPEERPEVNCGACHSAEASQHTASLHGQAAARGDPLAPSCTDCHGTHHIKSHLDPTSPTRVMNIPFLCGECHHEGTAVSRTRNIPEDRILENYSLSIHGTGLFRQGLTVTAVCTSCHTSHDILPHTDSRSSIHHDNVAATCAQCHGQIEQVHVAWIALPPHRRDPDLGPVEVFGRETRRVQHRASTRLSGLLSDACAVSVERGELFRHDAGGRDSMTSSVVPCWQMLIST